MSDIPYTQYRMMVAHLEGIKDVLERTIEVVHINRARKAQGLAPITINDDIDVIEGEKIPPRLPASV